MKLSEFNIEDINKLTIEQKTRIVYGYKDDTETCADVAILLGGNLLYVPKRVEKAAQLYLEGKVKYIVPTGGVEWEIDGEKISEALFMQRMLRKLGVPDEAIVLENEARTTKENMIYATLRLDRAFRIAKVRSVIIVTSPDHLKRSVMLGNLLLPRHIKVYGVSTDSEIESAENWYKSEAIVARIDRQIGVLKTLVDEKLCGDIEF